MLAVEDMINEDFEQSGPFTAYVFRVWHLQRALLYGIRCRWELKKHNYVYSCNNVVANTHI
jgi:hypothetical protein